MFSSEGDNKNMKSASELALALVVKPFAGGAELYAMACPSVSMAAPFAWNENTFSFSGFLFVFTERETRG